MTTASPQTERVLIVVDDRGFAGLYAEWIERDSDIETAYDGADAFDQPDETGEGYCWTG